MNIELFNVKFDTCFLQYTMYVYHKGISTCVRVIFDLYIPLHLQDGLYIYVRSRAIYSLTRITIIQLILETLTCVYNGPKEFIGRICSLDRIRVTRRDEGVPCFIGFVGFG